MAISLLLALLTGALAALPLPGLASSPPGPWDRAHPGLERGARALERAEAAVGTSFRRSDYPASWHFERVREPVFGGQVLVVEAGRANPQTLLLVHGLGQNGFRDWNLQIAALAAHFHVVALDLPGFGYSDVVDGRYSPTAYARVLAWLSGRYGTGKVHVAGHSMGATVALRFAADYPQLVDRLILIDAAGILERTAFLKHSAELPVELDRTPALLRRITAKLKNLSDSLVELSGYTPDPTRFLLRNERAWNLMFSDAPNANAGLALLEEDFTEAVSTLPHATTIIWGEYDDVAPLRTGQALAYRLPAARLVTIAGAGHVPLTNHSRTLNALLLEALQEPFPASHAQAVAPDSQGDLRCQDETGIVYRGRYRHIELDNCTAIRFEQVDAESISLSESAATFDQLRVDAPGVAILVRESVLQVTAGTITGETAILADDSRLDMAAVTVTGRRTAVQLQEGSRVILSISDLRSPAFTGHVHGAFRLADTSLDLVLADRSRAR